MVEGLAGAPGPVALVGIPRAVHDDGVPARAKDQRILSQDRGIVVHGRACIMAGLSGFWGWMQKPFKRM